MNIDILDEDGASNIAHPELFGKENKSELLKELVVNVTEFDQLENPK